MQSRPQALHLLGAVVLNLAVLLTSFALPAHASTVCENPTPSDPHAAGRALGRGLNLGYALEQCLGNYVHPPGANCKAKPAITAATESIEAMVDPSGEFWKRRETANAESFRLPVAWWHHHESTHDGRIRVGDAYFELVEKVIDAARTARPDAVIVVNLHEFNKIIGNRQREAEFYRATSAIAPPSGRIEGSGSVNGDSVAQRDSGTDLIQIWQDIARRLKDHPPGCVYFELLNEPQQQNERKGFSNYCKVEWREHIGELVRTIRATGGRNQQRPLIIGTCNPDDHLDLEALVGGVVDKLRREIQNVNPLIVTWHYYDPSRATHWRARCPQQDPTAQDYRGRNPDPGCASNAIRSYPYLLHDAPTALDDANRVAQSSDDTLWKANVEAAFAKAEAVSRRFSVPLYLGEFGYERYIERAWWPIDEKSIDALASNRERWICEIVSQAERRQISYGFWNLTASFGLSLDGSPASVDGARNAERLIDLVLPGKARPRGVPPDCKGIDGISAR